MKTHSSLLLRFVLAEMINRGRLTYYYPPIDPCPYIDFSDETTALDDLLLRQVQEAGPLAANRLQRQHGHPSSLPARLIDHLRKVVVEVWLFRRFLPPPR